MFTNMEGVHAAIILYTGSRAFKEVIQVKGDSFRASVSETADHGTIPDIYIFLIWCHQVCRLSRLVPARSKCGRVT